jgi:hypothetical protein
LKGSSGFFDEVSAISVDTGIGTGTDTARNAGGSRSAVVVGAGVEAGVRAGAGGGKVTLTVGGVNTGALFDDVCLHASTLPA